MNRTERPDWAGKSPSELTADELDRAIAYLETEAGDDEILLRALREERARRKNPA